MMMVMIIDADGSRMRSKKRIGDRPTDPTRHGTRRSLLQDRLFLCKNATMASKPFFEIAFFDAKMRFWPQQPPSKWTSLYAIVSCYFTANRSAFFRFKFK